MKNSSYDLDIIVPHYKEPWETVQKFFAMLDIQRGVDFDSFRVILVNDGEENAFPEEYFTDRPYTVEQHSIHHAGVSAARNHGLKNASAEWVMFCDCDDTFSNVYSLFAYIPLLRNNEYDVLWSEIFAEDRDRAGQTKLGKRGHNLSFIHGKLFRRTFLEENHIQFDPEMAINEDVLFNGIVNLLCRPERNGKVTVKDDPPYVWCFNEKSVTNSERTYAETVQSTLECNMKLCDAFQKHAPYRNYCTMVSRSVADAYYLLNVLPYDDSLDDIRRNFYKWYKAHERQWMDTPIEELRGIKKLSRDIWAANVKEHKNRWNAPFIPEADESISITQWLRHIGKGEA